MRTLFIALWILEGFTTVAQQPAWARPPRLVVGVVVDQMRADHLYRYWDNFGEGGFKRLVNEGAYLRNAHYTYMPTSTGPGHASIYTGTTPSHHGIVANYRYDRDTRKSIYCVADTAARTIGNGVDRRSPHQLLATTLGDEIERRTDGKGKTIGVALKDRASILPVGRTADAAYWISYATGEFITSNWYGFTELPAWVKAFNGKKLVQKYMGQTWEPVLPKERYHLAMPDDNPYEGSFIQGHPATFPYLLADALKERPGYEAIKYTPWGNTITTDMALAAVEGEDLGKDAYTDLLALSYSSTDELGHLVGPRAMELEDMYIRLDREIARLLNALDEQVGAGKYTLFLTADHGVVDVPQYLKDQQGSAGYVDTQAWKPILDSLYTNESKLMPSRTMEGYKVDRIFDGMIYLPESAKSTDYMRRIVDFVKQQEGVADAYLATDLQHGPALGKHGEAVANGFMTQRCGEILYDLRPGYIEAAEFNGGKGTQHRSGWNYDTNVPVLFFGQGIAHGEVVRRTAVVDIVPTLCMIVGCALPDAAVGDPVPEVLR